MSDEQFFPSPTGFAVYIDLGPNGEPLIRMVFSGEDESSTVRVTMDEAGVMMSIVGETMMRCAVIREMTTIFPEQRDTIMENLLFRWSGGPDGEIA